MHHYDEPFGWNEIARVFLQVHAMSSPVAARSPRQIAAASALVLFDGARANPVRAKKRSPLEAAEEKVRKVTLSTTKLKEELEMLLRKGAPRDVRATAALQNKKAKFRKSRDQLLPAAEAKLVDAKQKASDAKALQEAKVHAKVAMLAKKKDMHGA